MVRSREVTHYNTGNDLAEGAGQKYSLSNKGNFGRRPHLLTDEEARLLWEALLASSEHAYDLEQPK